MMLTSPAAAKVPLSVTIKEPDAELPEIKATLAAEPAQYAGTLPVDIHFRGTIKVSRDETELADIYLRLYGTERRSEKAFYIYELNTLYVTEQDFTKEILGHEMGHAIISNFFVVPAPEKVQEVLAGYIEYQLRKHTLPVPRQ